MATLVRRIAGALCIVLAAVCVCYSFAVRNTHSGTVFWIVWLAFAALFAVLGFGVLFQWWAMLPRLVRGVAIAVACVGLVAFGTVEGCIVSKMHAQGEPNLDYVVVLGAQVRKSGQALCFVTVSTRLLSIWMRIRIPSASFPAEKDRTSRSPKPKAWLIILKNMALPNSAFLKSRIRRPLRKTSSTARS